MKPLVKKCISLAIALLAVSLSALIAPNAITQASATTSVVSISTTTLTQKQREERRYYDESAVTPRGVLQDIYYARKEETYTLFDYYVPYYANNNNLPNACGPVAGAIVVGYYDRYFENLIPNFDPCYASGRYKFNDSTYVPALIQDLYTRMRTNVDDVGVSQSDCISGLTSYVQDKGRTISYTSIQNWNGSVNHSLCDNAIATGKPILLFCENFSLYSVGGSNGHDNWVQLQTTGAHIAVAFGYLTINYYDANDVLIRTDHHIEVASGWSSNRCGYLNANDSSWLNDGYIVNIS